MFTKGMIIAIILLAIGIGVAFLLGSIPWGLIIGKKRANIDIREHGSGNIGTTNSARVLGLKSGVMVLILDVAKGAIGPLVALLMLTLTEHVVSEPATLVAMLKSGFMNDVIRGLGFAAVVCGHMYSPFLHGKGGKGIAAAFGAMLAVLPMAAVSCLVAFVIVVLITRRVSCGSIAGAVALPVGLSIFYTSHPFIIGVGVVLMVCVIIAHRGNIKRLIHGEEPKFSLGKKDKESKSEDNA